MRPVAARRVAVMVTLVTAACAPGLAGGWRPTDAQRRTVRGEIGAMLMRGAANWNRGDLDAFVDDYQPGDTTTYIGKRVLRGPAAIRDAYAPRFAPGATRDSLSFVLLDVDPLGPDVANVIATYVLARRVGGRDSVTSQGPTSLVVRRVNGRWRIVHDHSS